MPNCKEVARLIASDELADAVWLNRTLVRLHLERYLDASDVKLEEGRDPNRDPKPPAE